jgi:hypothetical protein
MRSATQARPTFPLPPVTMIMMGLDGWSDDWWCLAGAMGWRQTFVGSMHSANLAKLSLQDIMSVY